MNALKSITGLLAGIAPALASAVAGPAGGAVAKVALGALGEHLGLPADKRDDASVAGALAGATPDQLLSLKQVDNEFSAEMKRLDIDLAKLHQEDRASARHMQERTRSLTVPILAWSVMGIFTALCAGVLWVAAQKDVAFDTSMELLIGGIVGYAAAMAQSVCSFYFGSSQSSEAANAHLGEAVRNGGAR